MLGVAFAWTALAAGCPGGDDAPAETEGGSTAGTAGSSSGEPACEPETQALYADAAMLTEPMSLGEAEMLQRDVARSHMADMGTMTMEFSTTCAGPIYVWALVWDHNGGIEPENPDSLYITIDDGEEQTWIYGCGTDEDTDMRWWWLPVDAWSGSECDHAPLELDLPEGDHTIVIRNREDGVDVDVAAIAAVVVSHDMEADPTEFIAPPT